jgi:very-short-patch-repair endonuclease
MAHKVDIDRQVLRIAEAQNGVIDDDQLRALGMTRDTITARRRAGRLVVLHRGVYALGHRALRPEGRWLAAVRAYGSGAVLSHRSAARLWDIRPYGGRVEVTVPTHSGLKQRDGTLLHRSNDLPADELATVDGIPTTAVARTLLDLAAVVPAHHLRRAVEAAEQRQLFDLRAVERTLQAHPRRPGRPALVALLSDVRDHGLTRTRSDIEAAMLQLCLDHNLPRPEVNHYKNGREVDFRWPAQDLLVEVDGWTTHNTRAAFTADRRRDRAALREGTRAARFTATEVDRAPAAVAAELRVLLRAEF